ncbi:proteasome assembly chaperone family protein [Salinibacterium sp. SWN1162]|uniref:proteasome assembly chaperone family protein n=1 Tax=Salinibacterium sp. SWN1162 TaxID=2792053 RepID=UPI0018CCD47E|nr:PAC2 family protein [Salinibacterium sp. SWN1162]MBH0009398.1 PAC2 family protein [Salinibacterium sp. SWN1162]
MTITPFANGRLLVVAFEGWNDAGEAASGAVRSLKEQLDVYPISEVDPEEYFDYQFNRPVLSYDDDGDRVLTWPSVTMYGPTRPNAGRPESIAADAELQLSANNQSNIYLLLGTEPSRSWKAFARDVLETVVDNGITSIVFLGAMLADVPHTRPISVFTSSENAAVRTALGIERSTYEGPVGILSILGQAAEASGVTTMSIWASVPHYVHNAPSPKATLALIDKLEEIVDVVIPRGELVSEAADWETGIDALAGEDEDMTSYIEQLEKARDTVDSPEASGEAIAQEFEKYLRRGDDKPDQGAAGDEPWRGKE